MDSDWSKQIEGRVEGRSLERKGDCEKMPKKLLMNKWLKLHPVGVSCFGGEGTKYKPSWLYQIGLDKCFKIYVSVIVMTNVDTFKSSYIEDTKCI